MADLSGKRGQSVILYFRVIGIVLAIGVFLLLTKFLVDASEDTLLKKNYVARDMALMLTAIYSAPGDVNYTYDAGNRFDIEIEGLTVYVSDDKGEVSYWYSKPEGMENATLQEGKYSEILFQKNNTGVRVIIP